MRHSLKMAMTVLAMALFAACTVGAAEFYVAPDGADDNPGSLEKPFKTPARGVSELMPGDTLFFRAGTYRCKTDRKIGLAPKCSGSKDKPVTLCNYKNEHVKLDVSGTDWGLSNNGFSWIVFDGFEVVGGNNNTKLGRGPAGWGSHVTIRNCLYQKSGGQPNLFAAGTKNIVIENCIFRHAGRSHGLYFAKGCDDSVVRNCTSHDNHGNSGMQFRGGIKNLLVENCILYNNAQGFSLAGVINSVFRNNVVYNNGYVGPRNSGWRDVILIPGVNTLLENNTFVNIIPHKHKIMNVVNIKGGSKNLTFRNNIVVCRGKPLFTIESTQGLVFENNCLYNIGGGEQVNGKGTLEKFAEGSGVKASGTVTADPKFKDIREGDFRIEEGSPCIDAGAETKADAKVAGKGIDIGAYEFGKEGGIGADLPWQKAE